MPSGSKLVRLCVDIGTFLRGRAAAKRTEAFDIVLASALEAVRGSAVFPGIADEIAAHLAGVAPTVFPAKAPAAAPFQSLDFREPPPGLPLAMTA